MLPGKSIGSSKKLKIALLSPQIIPSSFAVKDLRHLLYGFSTDIFSQDAHTKWCRQWCRGADIGARKSAAHGYDFPRFATKPALGQLIKTAANPSVTKTCGRK